MGVFGTGAALTRRPWTSWRWAGGGDRCATWPTAVCRQPLVTDLVGAGGRGVTNAPRVKSGFAGLAMGDSGDCAGSSLLLAR